MSVPIKRRKTEREINENAFGLGFIHYNTKKCSEQGRLRPKVAKLKKTRQSYKQFKV